MLYTNFLNRIKATNSPDTKKTATPIPITSPIPKLDLFPSIEFKVAVPSFVFGNLVGERVANFCIILNVFETVGWPYEVALANVCVIPIVAAVVLRIEVKFPLATEFANADLILLTASLGLEEYSSESNAKRKWYFNSRMGSPLLSVLVRLKERNVTVDNDR